MTYYPPVRRQNPPVVYRPTMRKAILGYVDLCGRVYTRRVVAYVMLMYGYSYGAIRNALWRLVREGRLQRIRRLYTLV